MGRRRLNQQQQRRVAQRRRTGGDDTLADGQSGLVIACYGSRADIEADDGGLRSAWLRANLGPLVAGDRVRWCPGVDGDVVVAREPRRSVLSRPDARGRLRPIAANVDCVVIVVAPDPEPHAGLLDRYLVAVEHQRLAAVIALNKCDLIKAGTAGPIRLLAPYRAIGYPVIETSAMRGDGLDALCRALAGGNGVIAGQSGVGKSSLINALVPGAEARTGVLSGSADNRGKGRHTTTAARLFHLPGNANLIDSPGIREFGLAGIDRADIAAGFREFRPYLGHCRFRDCRHANDPGCALRAACERGLIQPARLASYHHIAAEASVVSGINR